MTTNKPDDPKASHPPEAPMSKELGSKEISHFMTRKVVTVSPTTTIRQAMNIMLNQKVSGLPVVDNLGHCVGVVSELDTVIHGASTSLDSPVHFTQPTIHAKPTDMFKDVLVLMIKSRIKRVPILENGKTLVGVVSRRDLMKALLLDSEVAAAPNEKK